MGWTWEGGRNYYIDVCCVCFQVLHGEDGPITESTRRMNVEINAKVMEVLVCLVVAVTLVYLITVSCPAGAAGSNGTGGGGAGGDEGAGGAREGKREALSYHQPPTGKAAQGQVFFKLSACAMYYNFVWDYRDSMRVTRIKEELH